MTAIIPAPSGPFETASQADAAAEPMLELIRQADPVRGAMTDEVRAARRAAKVGYVTDTLTAAGVELGAHDQHIAEWIAGMWDPETTAVLLDWVLRAHAAGTGAVRAWRVEAGLNLPPVPEEFDALHAAGLADLSIESKAFDVRLLATVTASTKAEACALVRELVATVPGLAVDVVYEAHPVQEGKTGR